MEDLPEVYRLGSSFSVPCVQELAKKPLSEVPARYLRNDEDQILPNSLSLPQLPVIDMSNLVSGNAKDMELELEQLHAACKNWGFFQLTNHGVSTELLEKVKFEIQEFFNLPMEEKKKFWQKEDDMEGFGQQFVVSEEHKLNWGDMFYMVSHPTHLRKPHLFPKLPLSLREAMEDYSTQVKNLALKIFDIMAKALGMDPNDMRRVFGNGFQGIRMNYYPPCPQPELVIGLSSHSDASGITILLQINEMEGLQIKKDEAWIPIKPLPNAFIINVGDAMEVMSNGIYRSIEHRATVNSIKERLSVATFCNPALDGAIGPAPSLITPQTPSLFKTISVVDYFKGFFSRQLYGKSNLDVLRVNQQNADSLPI